MSVLLETSLGTLVIDLYLEERPKCSMNFLKLCQMKQYNFCLFHEVQKNLVAQTGDPTGTGRGGSSIFEHLYGEQARYFDAEKKPKISHARRGLVSMVDNGYGQHGSQFFITLADHLEYLDKKHTVFGQVAEGLDFVDRINEVFCDKENRPYRNVRIHHTIVLDDPFPTPEGLDFPASPSRIPVNRFLDSGVPRIEEDEELDDQSGLSPSKLAELKEEQEARTHAQLLTLIGDLPDADVKPPENVLFVCRLNPVTNSEDLEIIFSRFGPIRSCEVIRDRSTGASLQYAFIEFEKEEDCENAFFKMDKVVIDDRRIHVDFSQSVAKEWQKYRQHNRSEKTKAHSVRPDSDRPPTNPHTHRNRPPARRRSRSPLPVSRQHQRRRSPVKDSRTRQRSESPESPERFRRKDLPGPDLDLIVSDSDESNSSRAKHRHRKHRHHRESDKGSANRKHHKSKHKKEHSRHRHRS